MSASYRIKDWKKFQHFKNRRPPWIKLYRDILEDPDWHDLDPLSAKNLTMMWLIASEHDGNLPSVKKLAFRLRITESQTKTIISKLSHWLERDDITPISERYHGDAPEGETETETETETEGEGEGDAPAKPQKRKFLDFVFLTEGEYEKLVEKFGDVEANARIDRLNNGIGSKGYKYRSHYHTILSWALKDKASIKSAPSEPKGFAALRALREEEGRS